MQQAHEMGMSAQDELRFEVIQTLVEGGWTEADAIAAVKEIADGISRYVSNGLTRYARSSEPGDDRWAAEREAE